MASSNNYNNNWHFKLKGSTTLAAQTSKKNFRLFFCHSFFPYFDFAHHFLLHVLFLLFLLTLPYHKIEFSLLNNWSEHTHTHICRALAFLVVVLSYCCSIRISCLSICCLLFVFAQLSLILGLNSFTLCEPTFSLGLLQCIHFPIRNRSNVEQ